MTLTDLFATRSSRMKASEIRELLKLLDQPDIISFAGGIPDPSLFPHEAFAGLCRRARRRRGQRGAAVSGERGLPAAAPLAGRTHDRSRRAVRRGQHLHHLRLAAGARLSRQADAVARRHGAGDLATYLGALQAFNAYEPTYALSSRTAATRRRPSMRRGRRRGGRVKFAYLVPDFANPTGETLTRAQREGVLDLASELDCAVIEDAAYQALRYDGEPGAADHRARLRPLRRSRRRTHIYCGSFSKILAPAFAWAGSARRAASWKSSS